MAPNKFLAKIAADWRKPDGLFVIRPHQVEAFLAPLPVGRLPGVGKVMEAQARANWASTTVGDLRALARRRNWNSASAAGAGACTNCRCGIDEHPVQSERPTMQISAEDTFEHDLLLDELEPHIRRLAEKAWAGYERERARARRAASRAPWCSS